MDDPRGVCRKATPRNHPLRLHLPPDRPLETRIVVPPRQPGGGQESPRLLLESGRGHQRRRGRERFHHPRPPPSLPLEIEGVEIRGEPPVAVRARHEKERFPFPSEFLLDHALDPLHLAVHGADRLDPRVEPGSRRSEDRQEEEDRKNRHDGSAPPVDKPLRPSRRDAARISPPRSAPGRPSQARRGGTHHEKRGRRQNRIPNPATTPSSWSPRKLVTTTEKKATQLVAELLMSAFPVSEKVASSA